MSDPYKAMLDWTEKQQKKSLTGSLLLTPKSFVFLKKLKKSIDFFIVISDFAKSFCHRSHKSDSEKLWVLFYVDFGLPGERIDMSATEVVECILYLDRVLCYIVQAKGGNCCCDQGNNGNKFPEPVKVSRKPYGGNEQERQNGYRVCQVRDQMSMLIKELFYASLEWHKSHGKPPIEESGLGNSHSDTEQVSRQFGGNHD